MKNIQPLNNVTMNFLLIMGIPIKHTKGSPEHLNLHYNSSLMRPFIWNSGRVDPR